MRRSEVIGTCLVNSDYFDDLDSALQAVQSLFKQTYPKESFQAWDKAISDDTAYQCISDMEGKAEVDFSYLVTVLSRTQDG